MDAHPIDAVPDPAHLALACCTCVVVAPVDTAGGGAAGVTGAQQHGAREQSAPTQHKHLATLQAALALKGFELNPTPTGTYIVMRWKLARPRATLEDVQNFAQRVGAFL